MNKYTKALETLMNEYDAFYFENSCGEGTHPKEFEILSELEGELVTTALGWIRTHYDCYCKNEYAYDDNSAFAYLKGLAEKKEE